MPLRLQRDAWHIRLMGCLFGLSSLAIGFFNVWELGDTPSGDQATRLDFGLIAIVTGLIALLGSLLTPSIRDLWFCNPERSKPIAKEAGKTIKEMLFRPRRKK